MQADQCAEKAVWNTQTPIEGPFLKLPGWAGTRKVKPIWILLASAGLATCKSAPRSREITMPAPHHSVFYTPDALPAVQPTALPTEVVWKMGKKQVCVQPRPQLSTWHCPHLLLCATACYASHLLPVGWGAQQQTHHMPPLLSINGTDGHTEQAVSTTGWGTWLIGHYANLCGAY